MAWRAASFLAVCLTAAAATDAVDLPNPSFETGAGAPTGWTHSGPGGRWVRLPDGTRAVAVTGTGDNSTYWRSEPAPFEPSAVYRLRFFARSESQQGGTAITGPAFCNRDLGVVPQSWTQYDSIFATPAAPASAEPYLRFGQWHANGVILYDVVSLRRAVPVYARRGDLTLGEGEHIVDGHYAFAAPYRGQSRNQSRPLLAHSSAFNTDRWSFSARQHVTYRHEIGRHQITGGEIHVAVNYHIAGQLSVEASADGQKWQALGTIDKVASGQYAIPPTLLPARQVYVRLTASPAPGQSNTMLQVNDYGCELQLDGEPESLVGSTDFVAVAATDPRIDVTVDDLGAGGDSVFVATVNNRTGQPITITPTLAVTSPHISAVHPFGGQPITVTDRQAVRVPYQLPLGSGNYELTLTLGGQSPYRAEASIHIAELHDGAYGQRLPAQSDAAGLWWCSSGRKVSRNRPMPAANSDAMLIRAARNEVEAAQFIIRPSRDLKKFTARAEALVGPDGSIIPAENVEILRVRYVLVTRPTDEVGVTGHWPDPLPPFDRAIDLERDVNQPIWVRVKAPRNARPGIYTGAIQLAADGYADRAPIRVEVYDFDLPDRMTCVTTFGFSPQEVWRYQKLTGEADRRAVLAKYLANFSAHHIAPYDPAPMDAIKVTWPDRKTLVPVFDFAAWDRAMAQAVDEYHFNSFLLHVPGMGGGTYHARVEPELLGFREDSPEYKLAFANYCRIIEQHLRGKGWLDEAYVYWFDEPDPKDYAFVSNGFHKLKEAAPGINRMLTEQVEDGLIGGPNIWCPVSFEYRHDKAEQRRKAGERFWWYVCTGPKAPYCTLFIDHPATELRVWLWQTWQRKIEGILVWQTNYWTSNTAYPDRARPQNPYEDPMGWTSGYGTPTGTKAPWGNGDGRFIYPPEAAADGNPPGPVLDGPVDSIRWEMLRDGVEDYEYMVILKRLLEEKGSSLPAGQREAMDKLLEVPAQLTSDMTTFTRDPGVIDARRDEIARAIVSLRRK